MSDQVDMDKIEEAVQCQIKNGFEGNSEHLRNLLQGVEHWNKWLKEQRKKDPEFRPNFEKVDLRSKFIQETGLWIPTSYNKGAYLEDVCLNASNLSYVRFDYAYLSRADLSKSRLEGTVLVNTILDHSRLINSELMGVNISGTKFDCAIMKGADFRIISLDENTDFTETRFVDSMIRIGEEIDEKTAINVFSQGVVNNAQFVDPVLGRKVRDQAWLNKFKQKHPILYWLWFIFADCGRSFIRWAAWAFSFAVGFGFLFHHLGNKHLHLKT